MGRARRGCGKLLAAKRPAVERIRKQNPFDLIFKKSKAQIVCNAKPLAFEKRQAFDARQKTIGIEYKNHGKVNKIVDRRLAERDAGLSASEKAERRFILQRKLLFSKNRSSRFNLDDDDDEISGSGAEKENSISGVFLDHDGFFPAAKGEKFDTRKRIDRDDGQLDSDLVALANFGGGHFDDEKRAEVGSTKRENVLANLISASKQAKALRQMERDEQADNTDRLNEMFDKLKNSGALQLTAGRNATVPTVVGLPMVHGDAQSPTQQSAASSAVEKMTTTAVVVPNKTKVPDYDILYHQLLHNDSGRKAVASATKSLAAAGSPADLDEAIAELRCISMTPITAATVERVATLMERLYHQYKVRPLACSERLLSEVVDCRQQFLNSVTATPDLFGGVDFGCAALVRVVSRVFATGDRFHAVATPTLVFAAELLARSRVRGVQHVAQLLFLCDTLADWVVASRRYLSEVVAFLRGCLLLSVTNGEDEKFPSLSFPITSPFRQMLYVKVSTAEEPRKSKIDAEPDAISIVKLFASASKTATSVTTDEIIDESTPSKVVQRSRRSSKDAALAKPAEIEPEWSWNGPAAQMAAIRALLAVVRRFAELYTSHTVSYYAIFRPFLALLKRLPVENYPTKIADEARSLIEFVETKLATAPHLTQLKLPVRNAIWPVEMLEPRFDDNFDPTRVDFDAPAGDDSARKARKRERQMRQRLRKETRGAMKELRTDAKYIARLQHERAQAVSKDRREKTKRILSSLQTQESEYKKRKLKKY